jgi:hypothetical protein
MDFGYLVCSTLKCETEHFSSAAVIDDTLQLPPGVVEASCSEGSFNSDQALSASFETNPSISLRNLQSGYTSPSSLALQRRPPEAPVYLREHTYSTDSTAASTESSSSRRNNADMAIACKTTPWNNHSSQRGAAEVEHLSNKKFITVDRPEVGINNARFETALEQEERPEDDFKQFCLNPPPLRSQAWSEPTAEEYHVRSKNYMTDRIKEPSAKSAFQLITVDLINSETPIYTGMCAHPGERVQLALERERETGIRELPEFVFAVNLCIPADVIYHAVFYYGVDKATMDEIRNGQTAFGRVMKKFIFGDSDSYRNNAFKLIPRVVEGNYLVRKGVGSKPAILGKKIKQCYVRDDRYFEIIVDIASDQVAKRVTKLCLGYIKTIVVEMMFALEGGDESTLPERIFGGASINNLDFAVMDGKRCVR